MNALEKMRMIGYWIASTKGLTAKRLEKLIEMAGSEENLFFDPDIILKSKVGFSDEVKKNFAARANEDLLQSELYFLKKKNIKITVLGDDDYPMWLDEIHMPPRLLYYKGDLKRLSYTRLAVVGTRFPSYKGERNTRDICRELSVAGISIISGMARGIDTVAAQAALHGGTATAAVLGCGIDSAYPKENFELYEKICESGVVISEYAPGVPPLAEHFPARNRIISGMSQAVFIAEGKLKSGGAITVRNAIEQNRDVYALPGDISNPLAELPNSLIADGAIIVLGAQTFFDNMRISKFDAEISQNENNEDIELDFSEKQIYTLLKQGEFTAEQLSELCNMDISTVNLSLTMLEIKKAAVRLPGNLFTVNRR